MSLRYFEKISNFKNLLIYLIDFINRKIIVHGNVETCYFMKRSLVYFVALYDTSNSRI